MPRLIAPRPLLALLVTLFALLALPALAQPTNEDRLREALKRQTADLRALQDGQAALTAQIGELTRQRDALQQQLDAAKAQLAAKPAAPAAPAPAPVDDAELAKLRDALAAAQKDNAELQAALAKWQGAYREAAALAQAKDAEAKRLDASLKATVGTLGVCKQSNAKLIATARDILHLYETQDFRSLLLKSYEPLLGLKRVELDNMVQDYEDKIADTRFFGAANGKSAP